MTGNQGKMGITMQNAGAKLAKKSAETSARRTAQTMDHAVGAGSDATALDRRYGAIGIPAVAAAARYQGGATNPAYAPAPAHWGERTGEAA